ncbi:lipopolysaccharide biosynthesis protein [Polynucleobacter sp. MG-27-Goln-C1]|uniref:lipopolysaccharide biosynthesis protein n=1 Tax=Polynucleobacter sp. MG-27-Goln-C1 TaxID=1819726 RepID=UPI001C0ACFBF|nr:hypothetical protein [Polynucleobacter sp. MG-27-Goln-C1]MBU3612837.1 hypothetical protein [Polynucleobacter sp. MG-27-Goln-C1]
MKKTKKLKENQIDFLLVSSGRLLVALLTLVSIRMVTTYLDPVQFGELAILISLQTFFGLLFINPVGQYINLKTHQWWEDGVVVGHLKLFRIYFLLIALIGFVVAFIVGERFSGSGFHYAIVILLMILMASWNGILIYLLNMLGFRLASTSMMVITALISLCASVFLVINKPSAPGWFLGQSVGMFVGALVAILFLIKQQHQRTTKKEYHPVIDKVALWRYCFPLAAATAFMWCQLSGYRFFIEHYWGLAALGLLSIGLQIPSQIAALIESLVMQYLYPYFYSSLNRDKTQEGLEKSMSDLINLAIPIYILVCGGIMLGGPYLVKMLVGPQFYISSGILSIGALIEFFRMSANLFGNAAHAKLKTGLLAMPYFIGASTVFILLLASEKFGADISIAAVSLVIGGILMFVTMLKNTCSNLTIHLNKKTLITFFVLAVFMAIGSLFLPRIDDIFANLFALCIVGILILSILFVFLKNNSALKSMLSGQLRAN